MLKIFRIKPNLLIQFAPQAWRSIFRINWS